jgi:hypothetical protein
MKHDPFWIELNQVNAHHIRPVMGALVIEDSIPEPEEEELDDSVVSLKDIVATTHRRPLDTCRRRQHICTRENGGLMVTAEAEDLDLLPISTESVGEEGDKEESEKKVEVGRGKRKKVANRLYCFSDFTRHWDNKASDVD